ncbi:hypothetical protein HNY73_001295 [Argiope bruennichi]|uniref:Uncharacterized protein n=1 Tax=Argiope bruennichi TaxID=94029 RepID=A0A8T0G247_ARGBR|nr:hypothetical protein HNY73_001295 [Argiope bruennichi]
MCGLTSSQTAFGIDKFEYPKKYKRKSSPPSPGLAWEGSTCFRSQNRRCGVSWAEAVSKFGCLAAAHHSCDRSHSPIRPHV